MITRPHARPKAEATEEKKHLDALLDEALEETFPASDPLAILEPAPERRGRMQPDGLKAVGEEPR